MIRSRPDGSHYCDGKYCGFPLAWFAGDPEEAGDCGLLVCLDCNASMYASAPEKTAAISEPL